MRELMVNAKVASKILGIPRKRVNLLCKEGILSYQKFYSMGCFVRLKRIGAEKLIFLSSLKNIKNRRK